ETIPDAASVVARLRQMREQRELKSGPAAPAPPRPAPADADEARFRPGDQIVCAPYGRGEVLASRVEDDREILVVSFPNHGELTIDAVVSAARLVETLPQPDDDPPL
ncbi:MAG TPA: hypothetical protein PKD53_33760, partial [Chloroflexaceae bacterium]|nr:hypothetical protein [Chloroflexaceae bacterium]